VKNEQGEILPPENCDDPDLSKKAIRATQPAIAWETYSPGSRPLISAVRSFLNSNGDALEFSPEGGEDLAKQSLILQEYLDLLAQRAESLSHRARLLRARAEVQADAVRSFTSVVSKVMY
jgi:hypothetical protein